MTHLLEKNTPFIFSEDCILAFQTLKKKLTEAPILIAPNWDQPFEIMCDASDYAIGAVDKCTDVSKITRKQLKTGKHEHENGRVNKSRKHSQEKSNPQSKMAGLNLSNHKLLMNLSSMDHTSAMVKAQRGVGFALDPLTELAQHVTSKNDMLAILRCPQYDPTAQERD
ncbi:reverse transcriptase domain-containing protein [Tanacetum coccineum]|uniref:Reverse transcriptase domain-containing protein n=1 Tax=Tanacetum coccineum TaxID=301880 RepID=A0ABQ5J9I8_9ASTR